MTVIAITEYEIYALLQVTDYMEREADKSTPGVPEVIAAARLVVQRANIARANAAFEGDLIILAASRLDDYAATLSPEGDSGTIALAAGLRKLAS